MELREQNLPLQQENQDFAKKGAGGQRREALDAEFLLL
jgi:hypothetical protein